MRRHDPNAPLRPRTGGVTPRHVGRFILPLSPCMLACLCLPAARAEPPGPQPAPLVRAEAPADSPRRSPQVEMLRRARASVVNLHSERTVHGPLDGDAGHRVNGMGTGLIIDPRGYVVTNYHVVEGVSVIRARLADGSLVSARVIGKQPSEDIALLLVEAGKKLPTLPFGTASDLMIGEDVFAVGNAFGYEHTVTRGIVSSVGRDVTLSKEMAYRDLIQTDTAINPGNSGGPLLNVYGEVVGLNVAIRAGAQNIAFAIPAETVLRVTADLMAERRRDRVKTGLALKDCVERTDPIRRLVAVDRVEAGGPAAAAGIASGDVLIRAGDLDLTSRLDFERAMADRQPGEALTVVYRRNGQDKTVTLTTAADGSSGPPPTDVIWQKLGVKLAPVGADAVLKANPQLHGGLTVRDVAAGGVAGQAGIQRGDILIGLHQWETLSVDNVAYVLTHPDLATFSPLKFFVLRDGQVRRGTLAVIE